MEVGWYLRLSRAARIEAVIRPDSVSAVEDQCRINPGWLLRTQPEGDFVRAVLTREKR